VGGREVDPALGDPQGPRVGDDAHQGHGDAGAQGLQREGGAREAGTRALRRLRARQREGDLLLVSPLLDHELRGLPPADPGELEDGAQPLRGRRHSQLRHL
jgi:hypothetical protein